MWGSMAKLKFGSPAWRKKYLKNAGKKKRTKRKNTAKRKPASARRKRAATNRNSAVNLKRNPPKGWITNVKSVKIVRNRGQVRILVKRARPRKRK